MINTVLRTPSFDPPTDDVSILRRYTLTDDDPEHVNERRRPENRIGPALQLCRDSLWIKGMQNAWKAGL